MGLPLSVGSLMSETTAEAAVEGLKKLRVLLDRAEAAIADRYAYDYHEALDKAQDHIMGMIVQAENAAGTYTTTPPSPSVISQEMPGVPIRPLPPITPQQRQALDAIRSLINSLGYAPSVRDVCKAMGLNSSSTVHVHLVGLAKKGYIEYGDGPRRIRLLV